jgi:OmpR-family two-component system manganese-sensing sensor histidine kinase
MVDLTLGTSLTVVVVAGIGWLLSGIAIAPVLDSYQRLKQFTADASHELRNPIAVIQTNVQVALADPEPDIPTQQAQFQVIERLTRRLGRLVDDLLFLTRQESGLVPLRREPLDLDLLLAEVTEEQQAIAQEKGITLCYTVQNSEELPQGKGSSLEFGPGFDHDPLTILGDADQLTRLFTNLIGNALQYTPTGGQVDISLKLLKFQGHTGLQIQVKDTGIGISPESLPHVFDRFFREDPARSRSLDGATGSGLGLAIAKVIVDNHKGTIRIDSVLNQGTTVTVLFYRPGLAALPG